MSEIAQFFSIDSFMPHGHCYLWQPSILWLNVLSDGFIALAYVSIPFSLLYILRKRRDLPFSWIFVAFGAFIISCGMTHVMEIISVWIPLYAIAGIIKAITASVSILTAILLIKLIPLILSLPSPVQLRIANENLQNSNELLQNEIVARQNSEESLRQAYDKLTLLNQELVAATEKAIRADVLEKSERRFYSIVEGAPHGQLVVNMEGKIELANQQIEKIFGYSRDKLIGESVDMLLPEKFCQHHMQFRMDYFSKPEAKSMGVGRELHGLRENGEEVPLEIGLNPIEFDDGMKVLCGITDISERIHREREFKKLSEALDRTSRMSGIGGWELELDTKALYWSDETYRIHEIPKTTHPSFDEAINFYSPEARPIITDAIQRAIDKGEGWDLELPFVTALGKSIWVRTIGTVEFDTDIAVRLVGTFQDITERKNFIDELARSNQELESFAYIASHDLKSPLRAVDQLATWLHEDLGEKLDEENLSHLKLMRGRIKRMEKLLDDLLAYSRAGKKDNNLILTNTKELIESVFDMCNATTAFKLTLEGDFPDFVTASVPLEQVFRNLISNAIKHGNKTGEISISVTSNNKFYIFSVADNGPGIPQEYEELAFSMFQTLRPRDEVEGSGMGLAIVKKIVELFGGSIHLEQNKSVGAKFVFTWKK